MRPFRALITLVCCLVLYWAALSSAASPASSSLAAYSETRSFRDALDGRSMEEAMSGPVDKDTSSYGDRTSGANSQAMQAPSMMLAIPANGNLQTQQQSTDGGELEREAGPIDSQVNVVQEPQQTPIEQKSAKQQRRRMSLSSPIMLAMMQRSGRQQQQQMEGDFNGGQQPAGEQTTKTTSGSDQGFGDEQTSSGKQPSRSSAPGKTVSDETQKASQSGGAYGQAGQQQGQQAEEGVEQQNEAEMPQQRPQQMTEQQMDKSFQSAGAYDSSSQQQMMMNAKQRAMAAMMMGLSNNMKYSRPTTPANQPAMGDASAYGDKKPSSMAKNAMMSLANKAAYMGAQQRQTAPAPMMISNNYSGASDANGSVRAAVLNKPASSMSYNSARNMRRASQRRNEKKMSPAMVNAMLKKMAGAMKDGEQGYAKNSPMAAAMMMMKSPGGSELLAQMLNSNGKAADQYKRDMVASMLQQQQQQQQQQQEVAGNEQEQYGSNGGQEQMNEYTSERPMEGAKSIANYASSTMMPMNPMMNTNGGQRAYAGGEQAPTGAMRPQSGPMSGKAAGIGMEQQQEEQQYGMEQQQQQTNDGSDKARSYGSMATQMPVKSQMQSPMPAQMQMQIPIPAMMMMIPAGKKDSEPEMMPAVMVMNQPSGDSKGSSMNGFRQAYQPQQQQQQQQNGYNSAKQADGYGSPMPPMRPASNGATMGGYEQQQQQQVDEYGSAPLGQAEPFAFDYKIADDYGNGQYRKEESDKNGVVRGSYGYMDNSGIYRHVEYVADENGFRANIKSNEPGLSSEPAGGQASQAGPNRSATSQAQEGQSYNMAPANEMQTASAPGSGYGMTQQMQQMQQTQQMQQQQTNENVDQ